MAYDLQLVELPSGSSGMHIYSSLIGLPSSFQFLLFSMWVCLGDLSRIVSFNGAQRFGGINATNAGVRVTLNSGFITEMFNAEYTAPIGAYRSNVLVSVDGLNGIVQVYVNDLPQTITSGGWVGPPAFFDLGAGDDWILLGTGSSNPGSNVGDLFVAAPNAFFDLRNTSNRRKFIAADLTPVDLGTDGHLPLGVVPPDFLHVPVAGVASDFATNFGTGPTWTIAIPPLTFEVPDTCLILPPPPMLPKLSLDNVVVTSLLTESPCTARLFSPAPVVTPSYGLRWSDTRGLTWGNPVPQEQSTNPLSQPQWNRTGMARDRVFELFWSSAFKTAVNGAFVEVVPWKS